MPETLESLLGFKGGDLGDALFFNFGKGTKSPFEDPNIVRPSSLDNLYGRLGLENFVNDASEIRSAYRRQALIWHPDRNPPKYKEDAEKEFKAITQAYNVLIDPTQKIRYDGELRRKLRTDNKPNDWQSTRNNAQNASRYARDFKNIGYIDSQLSPEQRARVDYLDFLVDSGQIILGGFGDVLMADTGKACDYCSERIPSRNANINYKSLSMRLPDIYTHSLLAHGTRAMIATRIKTVQQDQQDRLVEMAYDIVGEIYKQLKIDLPKSALSKSI